MVVGGFLGSIFRRSGVIFFLGGLALGQSLLHLVKNEQSSFLLPLRFGVSVPRNDSSQQNENTKCEAVTN